MLIKGGQFEKTCDDLQKLINTRLECDNIVQGFFKEFF
jgi:hypothetical protein